VQNLRLRMITAGLGVIHSPNAVGSEQIAGCGRLAPMDWPSGIFRREQALQQYGRARVEYWLQSGAWTRRFSGVYASADMPADDPRLDIRLAVESVGDLVVVRESAAVLHGFGILGSETVHLAGGPAKTARSRRGLQTHGYKLAPNEIARVDGMRVTTAERTVIDLARSSNRLDALAVIDAALRIEACTVETLAAQADSQRSSRGIVQARQIIKWGDGDAESPMESRARLRILDSDLPTPVLQWWVCDGLGRQIYRLDLGWPERKVGLEYDGVDHLDKPRQRHDIERQAWLSANGWRILHVTDVDVYRLHHRMITRLNSLLTDRQDQSPSQLAS